MYVTCRPGLLVAEVLRRPGDAALERHADAEMAIAAVEDVSAVPGALHPGRHHRLRSGIAVGDVFSDSAPIAIAGARDAGAERRLAGELMAELPGSRHQLA